MVLMKTPNDNNEKDDSKDTEEQQFLVSYFVFILMKFFLLNRKSNSLEILYYGKQEIESYFVMIYFRTMCGYWAVTNFFFLYKFQRFIFIFIFAIVTIYNT